MKKSEYEDCAKNGVDKIAEVQVGLDGVAFAEAKGGLGLKLTPADVYKALAANPYGKPNTAKTWKDVNPAYPAEPILVYGPQHLGHPRCAEGTDPGQGLRRQPRDEGAEGQRQGKARRDLRRSA